AVAATARGQAQLVPARQPARPQLLVLGRSAGDGTCGWAHRCRAVLHRCRCDTEPGRLAAGRCDQARPAQRSPPICADLVRLGDCDDGGLRPVSAAATVCMSAYEQLEAAFARIGAVEEATSVLNWDQAAMMPPGGAAARAEQLATLRRIAHEMLIVPEI